MKKDTKDKQEKAGKSEDLSTDNLQKELKELIDEGETRTEAYMKLIKEIEKRFKSIEK